jgi:hypothetical protein
MGVIEPVPPPDPAPREPLAKDPLMEPIVLEDLVTVIRLPALFKKLDRILAHVLQLYQFPDDYPFEILSTRASDGIHEYGISWSDKKRLLRIFAGMCWGTEGHDPIWEARVECLSPGGAEPIKQQDLHRMAARRADGRFSEWDRFWSEDESSSEVLIGASAACSRFFEEAKPDQVAAEYLAGALHAMQASGALLALLEAAQVFESAKKT